MACSRVHFVSSLNVAEPTSVVVAVVGPVVPVANLLVWFRDALIASTHLVCWQGCFAFISERRSCYVQPLPVIEAQMPVFPGRFVWLTKLPAQVETETNVTAKMQIYNLFDKPAGAGIDVCAS